MKRLPTLTPDEMTLIRRNAADYIAAQLENMRIHGTPVTLGEEHYDKLLMDVMKPVIEIKRWIKRVAETEPAAIPTEAK